MKDPRLDFTRLAAPLTMINGRGAIAAT